MTNDQALMTKRSAEIALVIGIWSLVIVNR